MPSWMVKCISILMYLTQKKNELPLVFVHIILEKAIRLA